jgi:hypothetical protein
VPAALLSGTLAAAKWATATAFPASRVHLAPLFERPALTPRVTWGRAKPRPLAGSNPPDRWDRIETTILDVPRHKGGIQIPPDTRSVRKLVIPLPQRLFLVRPINVAEPGQARVARSELDQLAASSGLSLKHPHEHAGGANLKALAVALTLPRFIGQLFGFDRCTLAPFFQRPLSSKHSGLLAHLDRSIAR